MATGAQIARQAVGAAWTPKSLANMKFFIQTKDSTAIDTATHTQSLVLTKGGSTITLVDSSAPFLTTQIGNYVAVSGMPTSGNNGIFRVLTRPSTTTITYTNAAGAAETASGTWRMSGHVDRFTDFITGQQSNQQTDATKTFDAFPQSTDRQSHPAFVEGGQSSAASTINWTASSVVSGFASVDKTFLMYVNTNGQTIGGNGIMGVSNGTGTTTGYFFGFGTANTNGCFFNTARSGTTFGTFTFTRSASAALYAVTYVASTHTATVYMDGVSQGTANPAGYLTNETGMSGLDTVTLGYSNIAVSATSAFGMAFGGYLGVMSTSDMALVKAYCDAKLLV